MEPSAAPTFSPRARRVLWLVALGSVVGGLVLRVWHRGPYVPGWDVLGAAQGVHLLATSSAADVAAWYWREHWNPVVGWNLYGVPSVLVPGALATLWPWEGWNHVVTFAVAMSSGVILAAAVGLPRRDAWVALLAFGASPALLSQSVAGLAYVSAVLPHALALWTVCRRRERPLQTALLAVIVFLVAWQGQELGRTAFAVFLAAAVGVRAPRATRAVWVLAGAGILAASLRWPTYNTTPLVGTAIAPAAALSQIGLLLDGIVRRAQVDLPVLLPLGIVATLALRRDAWLWRLALAAQLALMLLLAAHKGASHVWPRRVVVVDAVCWASVLALWMEHRRSAQRALVAVLVVGCVWQMVDTVRWAAQPLLPPGLSAWTTLPFVGSTVDYRVAPELVDWERRIEADVRAGKLVILDYNLASYSENATDPAAVIDRLYLRLGHDTFTRQVAIFGSQAGRWNTLPIHPLEKLDAFVDGIADPANVAGHALAHAADASPQYGLKDMRQAERAALHAALRRRFRLLWRVPVKTGLATYSTFALAPKDAP